MDRMGEHMLGSDTEGDRPQAAPRVPAVVHPVPPMAVKPSATVVTTDSNQGLTACANISLPAEEGGSVPTSRPILPGNIETPGLILAKIQVFKVTRYGFLSTSFTQQFVLMENAEASLSVRCAM